MPIRIGHQCKLFINGGTWTSPSWNEVANARNVTASIEADEADVTTRGTGGWKQHVATLRDFTIEFDLVFDSDDNDVTLIRNAAISGGNIELAVLDGPSNSVGSQGPRAVCHITKFERQEQIGEAVIISVTAKSAFNSNAPTWLVVSNP